MTHSQPELIDALRGMLNEFGRRSRNCPNREHRAKVIEKAEKALKGNPPASDAYYIQNRLPCGNCVMWWREGSNGYTCDIGQAGRFTIAEASRIVESRPDIDKAYPCDEVDARVVRHVDFQSLRDVETLKIQVGQDA